MPSDYILRELRIKQLSWISPNQFLLHLGRAHPGTLGHWIKDNLKAAGVDTGQFTTRSTRNASTSQAHSKGVPINDILKMVNWSSKSTFEKFYHRTQGSPSFTRAVLQERQANRYNWCMV